MDVHELTFRVAMRDMDAVNIYYAAYYEWMERSLGEFFASAGHPVSAIFGSGLAFPTVQSGCTYRAPVSLDEVLRVRSWVSTVGRTSFTVRHEFSRDGQGELVAEGFATYVWVKRPEMTPIPVPDWIRSLAAGREATKSHSVTAEPTSTTTNVAE
jgi:YbgC/YbaW family acyl-CoA thioester hydrolase